MANTDFDLRNSHPIHDKFVTGMNKCIQKTEIPERMTKRKTTLIQKDPLKGNASINYRPIRCQLMIWKILTAQVREKIYISLISREIFPEEQKGCRKRTRGTEELVYIDQHTLNKSKTRRKIKLLPGLITKRLPMVVQSWILHSQNV